MMFDSNLKKMKLSKGQSKLQLYPNQSPSKITKDKSGKRKRTHEKILNNGINFEPELENSAEMLNSEIEQIFKKAKEEAINTIESIFENAKLKAEASIQKIASRSWIDNHATVEHYKISSGVNKMSLNERGTHLADITEETIVEIANEQSDIKLDNTEAVIKGNLDRFEFYISDCVKTTDLIVFFDLFTSAQTKELRSIYKQNPVEATLKALKMIHKMKNQSQKYRKLLEALTDAGYPKVVEILNGTLIPIGSVHRELIRVCEKHIFQRLNTSEVLPYLFSKGVISNDDKQQVLRTEKVESTGIASIELLHMLPNRNKQWFKHFIESLNESNHHDLAKLIEDNTHKIRSSNTKDTGIPNTQTLTRQTSRLSLSSRRKPKRSLTSGLQIASENNDGSAKPTQEHEIDNVLDDQRRPTSPISVSSDDHSCVHASRLDHGLDLSDSSFPLDNE